MVDGMTIQVVPNDYLPPKTAFLITHPCAMCSPVKLAEYNVHDNPPGISGWLIEGRTYYDAFVFNNKRDAIALVIDDYQVNYEASNSSNSNESDNQNTGL